MIHDAEEFRAPRLERIITNRNRLPGRLLFSDLEPGDSLRESCQAELQTFANPLGGTSIANNETVSLSLDKTFHLYAGTHRIMSCSSKTSFQGRLFRPPTNSVGHIAKTIRLSFSIVLPSAPNYQNQLQVTILLQRSS